MFETARRTLLAVAGACALLGADRHDGDYTLVSVDGQGLPYNLISVDSKNKLVLTQGVWTLSGDRLTTRMWTTSVVNGASTKEARFNPERHTAHVAISGNTAAGTLDTGSAISVTFEADTMLTTYNGHRLKLVK